MSREEKYSDAELASFGIDRSEIPRHVAVIMDGNGRWAQKHGWPRIEGHRRGVTSVRCIVEEASRLGIEQLTLYCFSSENWKRPPKELTLLMHLLKQYLVEERREIQRQGLRFSVIGKTAELDPMIQVEMQKTIDASAGNKGMTLCLAINYGARLEITEAVQRIAEAVKSGHLRSEDITEKSVADYLMTNIALVIFCYGKSVTRRSGCLTSTGRSFVKTTSGPRFAISRGEIDGMVGYRP